MERIGEQERKELGTVDVGTHPESLLPSQEGEDEKKKTLLNEGKRSSENSVPKEGIKKSSHPF